MKIMMGIVSICILTMFASTTMARADVVYPNNPVAGCVGFPEWWSSEAATLGAKEMILFVMKCLADAGFSDAEIQNIIAGIWYDVPLP